MLEIIGQIDSERDPQIAQADLVIVACGFESRSRALSEKLLFKTARRFALNFNHSQELSYNKNRKRLIELGYEFVDIEDENLAEWLLIEIERASEKTNERPLNVFIDISSQSRTKLAQLIEGLARAGSSHTIVAHFGYSIAKYSSPSQSPSPTVALGPVSPYFAGWSTDPELPLSMIVGLGYEQDRAVGAVEYLEPTSVWAFLPKSAEPEYENALVQANKTLLEQVEASRRIEYAVEDPNATFAILMPLVRRLSATSTVMLLPSGPKILVLLTLLIACTTRSISVWRASSGQQEPAVDRIPSGRQIFVRCVFGSSNGV